MGYLAAADMLNPSALVMIDAAEEAIGAWDEGEWDREIELPGNARFRGRKMAQAYHIVEGFRLHVFLTPED